MVTVYFITIHDKTGVEISNLKSISYDEHCCNSERKALKDDSLSVFIIIFAEAHNTKGVLIHPGKIRRNLLTVWTEKRRFIEIGRVIG